MQEKKKKRNSKPPLTEEQWAKIDEALKKLEEKGGNDGK